MRLRFRIWNKSQMPLLLLVCGPHLEKPGLLAL